MTAVQHRWEGLDDLAYKLRTAGCTSDSIEMRFDTRTAFELAARLDKVDALDRREAALKAAFTEVAAAQTATKQALAMAELRTRQWSGAILVAVLVGACWGWVLHGFLS